MELTHIAALIAGIVGALAWQRYVWPIAEAKRAAKARADKAAARTAKAAATRRANAMRKAATNDANGGSQA